MRTFAAAAATIALLAAPAYAQQQKGKPPSPEQLEAKQKNERIDKEYRDALERTKGSTQEVKSDPWATIRPDPAATQKAKTAR